eukprot:2112196-Rhodomonas_salina.3
MYLLTWHRDYSHGDYSGCSTLVTVTWVHVPVYAGTTTTRGYPGYAGRAHTISITSTRVPGPAWARRRSDSEPARHGTTTTVGIPRNFEAESSAAATGPGTAGVQTSKSVTSTTRGMQCIIVCRRIQA